MQDSYGRKIDYLRISVTDRCNFRCTYCMPQHQRFLPRSDLLDYTEIALISRRFIKHGIRKIRLTGGEPLVRRDVDVLIRELGRHVQDGQLDELTLTTNGSRLAEYAPTLRQSGVSRINVSLDSLKPAKFREITRGGELPQILAGIDAARAEAIAIRINMVALKGINDDEIGAMADYCAQHGHDLALIETMPLGEGVAGRTEHFIALDQFIEPLRARNRIIASEHRTAGPARYYQVDPLGLRLGLITPMTHNFCGDCNRLRLGSDGKVHMCLGSNFHVDFRDAIRNGGADAVDRLLQKALRLKPERHDFERQLENRSLRLHRHMNATGG
ncbi:MAG: GTP 3',8-cyclase MoaA [Sphingomonadales bacterium]|jgi:cyclic pyranopterin phosphate synthase|nr:GTP 3',8-cyclase MoaA [Sphingomonadales bacterium]MBK9003714.1 GTP 3',8-cyclase MoaA [Sphingomonadales bacterium]MBK9268888.1 GTP 3',8-cyclase MoaA [Sphingomonadales bacterium]MBP6434958.1 GTP 3',8-cyclase MoaA [Sphingorhabdus sp.]